MQQPMSPRPSRSVVTRSASTRTAPSRRSVAASAPLRSRSAAAASASVSPLLVDASSVQGPLPCPSWWKRMQHEHTRLQLAAQIAAQQLWEAGALAAHSEHTADASAAASAALSASSPTLRPVSTMLSQRPVRLAAPARAAKKDRPRNKKQPSTRSACLPSVSSSPAQPSSIAQPSTAAAPSLPLQLILRSHLHPSLLCFDAGGEWSAAQLVERALQQLPLVVQRRLSDAALSLSCGTRRMLRSTPGPCAAALSLTDGSTLQLHVHAPHPMASGLQGGSSASPCSKFTPAGAQPADGSAMCTCGHKRQAHSGGSAATSGNPAAGKQRVLPKQPAAKKHKPVHAASASAAAASVAQPPRPVLKPKPSLPDCPALAQRLEFLSAVNQRYNDWVEQYYTDPTESNGSGAADAAASSSSSSSGDAAAVAAEEEADVSRDVMSRYRAAVENSTSHAQAWVDVAKNRGVRLMVFGGKRMGKSSLLSALVGNGHRLLPERPVADSFTMVPTEIGMGTSGSFVVTLTFSSKNEWRAKRSELLEALLEEFPLQNGEPQDETETAEPDAEVVKQQEEQEEEKGGEEETNVVPVDSTEDAGMVDGDASTLMVDDGTIVEEEAADEGSWVEEDPAPPIELEPTTLQEWLGCRRSMSAGNPLRALYRKLDLRETFVAEGACAFDDVVSLLHSWLDDELADEAIVNRLLLDGGQDADHHATVECQFEASEAGFRDLNNFLFRVAVDHSSEALIDELYDENKQAPMEVLASLRKFVKPQQNPITTQSTSATALFECLCPADFTSQSAGNALVSLWPLITKAVIQIPASHWAHLPPNVTFFDTPGTSVQMLKARNKEEGKLRSADAAVAEAVKQQEEDSKLLQSDDLAWVGALDINHVWLVSLAEGGGHDPETLHANLTMLASSCLLPATDVIITKSDQHMHQQMTQTMMNTELQKIATVRQQVKQSITSPTAAFPAAASAPAAAAVASVGMKRTQAGNAAAVIKTHLEQAVPARAFRVSTWMFQAERKIPGLNKRETSHFNHLREQMEIEESTAEREEIYRSGFDELFLHLRKLSFALIIKAEQALSHAVKLCLDQGSESRRVLPPRAQTPPSSGPSAAATTTAVTGSVSSAGMPSTLASQLVLLDSVRAAIRTAVDAKLQAVVQASIDAVVETLSIYSAEERATLQNDLNEHIHSCYGLTAAATLSKWVREEDGQWASMGKPLDIARTIQQFYFDKHTRFKKAFTLLAAELQQQLHTLVTDFKVAEVTVHAIQTWLNTPAETAGTDAAHLQSFREWRDKLKVKQNWGRFHEDLKSKIELARVNLEKNCRDRVAGFVKELPFSFQQMVSHSSRQAKSMKKKTATAAASSLPVGWLVCEGGKSRWPREKALRHIVAFVAGANTDPIQHLVAEWVRSEVCSFQPQLDDIRRDLVDDLDLLLQSDYLASCRLSHLSDDAINDLTKLQGIIKTSTQDVVKARGQLQELKFVFELPPPVPATPAPRPASPTDSVDVRAEYFYERSYVHVTEATSQPAAAVAASSSSASSSSAAVVVSDPLVLIFRGIFCLQTKSVTKEFKPSLLPASPLYVPLPDMYRSEWAHVSSLALILWCMRHKSQLFQLGDDGKFRTQEAALVALLPELDAVSMEVRECVVRALRHQNPNFVPPRAQSSTGDPARPWRAWWDDRKNRFYALPYLPFQQRYSNTDAQFMADFAVFIGKYRANMVQHVINSLQRNQAAKVLVWSWIRQLVEHPKAQLQQASAAAAAGSSSAGSSAAAAPVPASRPETRSTSRELERRRMAGASVLAHAGMHANPSVSCSKNAPHAAKYSVGLKEYIQGNIKIQRSQTQSLDYGASDDLPLFCSSRVGDLLGTLLVFVMRRSEISACDHVIDVERCNQRVGSAERCMWVDSQILHEKEVTFYGGIDRNMLKIQMGMHILNWDDATLQKLELGTDGELVGQYSAFGFTPQNVRSVEKCEHINEIRSLIWQLVDSANATERWHANLLLRKKFGDLALQELHGRVQQHYTITSGNWNATDAINLSESNKAKKRPVLAERYRKNLANKWPPAQPAALHAI